VKYHLDTSTVIEIIRFRQETLLKFELTKLEDMAISAIVAQELWSGTSSQKLGPRSTKSLRQMLSMLTIVPFGPEAAETAGLLEAELSRKGTQIGVFDSLIAGHALTQGATLVTQNVKDFKRVPGLEIVDWTKSPD
jgi:tRNA(fMet)-specific endonuclease VapC